MEETLKFALFGNVYQAKKSASVKQLISLLTARGAELYVESGFYDYLTRRLGIKFHPNGIITGRDFYADIAVSMGGDGTFLAAASQVGDKRIPILGINMGRLGFLADVSPEEIEGCIDDIYNQTYKIEERSVIEVQYEGPRLSGYPFALNEVAVLKRDNSSMISIRVEVDGGISGHLPGRRPHHQHAHRLHRLRAERRGPHHRAPVRHVLHHARSLPQPQRTPHHLARPGAAHAVGGVAQPHFLVAIDGRSEACTEHTRLHLSRAPYNIKVLQRKNHSFYSTLREKLMWGTDPREESC